MCSRSFAEVSNVWSVVRLPLSARQAPKHGGMYERHCYGPPKSPSCRGRAWWPIVPALLEIIALHSFLCSFALALDVNIHTYSAMGGTSGAERRPAQVEEVCNAEPGSRCPLLLSRTALGCWASYLPSCFSPYPFYAPIPPASSVVLGPIYPGGLRLGPQTGPGTRTGTGT